MNFLDPNNFNFLKPIKDNFQVILEEYNNVAHKSTPWMERYLHNDKWDVIGFKFDGKDFPENKILAPKTCELFESIDAKVFTYGFSILRAGCEIKPHVNDNHDVLRSHICLYTNPDAFLVVNNEARNWVVGDLLVFDDNNEHYAFNKGTTDRIIVLFDFYK
jgi:beta-hydroxylase